MRGLGPLGIDHPRRITETPRLQAEWQFGDEMAFRPWSSVFKPLEAISPNFPLNSFLSGRIGRHIALSKFVDR